MARYTGPKCRLSRREGTDLFYQGDKYSGAKRPYPPGQHGQRRGRLSDYGVQLREKQKIRRMYGVLEKQFRLYYEKADRSRGVTGEVLLQLLERRLDNIVFRMGFGVSRSEARQIVSHRLVQVNGQYVNIPSYQVKSGDVVEVANRAKEHLRIKSSIEQVATGRGFPEWVEVDQKALKGTVKRLPERSEMPAEIQEQLVVELYSK